MKLHQRTCKVLINVYVLDFAPFLEFVELQQSNVADRRNALEN